MEGEEERGSFWNEYKSVIIIFTLAIFLVSFLVVIFYLIDFSSEAASSTCGDGTLFNDCSLNKPYFCDNSTLVEKASVCGCLEGLTRQEDFCISKHQNQSKNISLDYVLRGVRNTINFEVYKDFDDYLFKLPKSISYSGNQTPLRSDFIIRNLNDSEQKELLLPLVVKIQNLAEERVDQARIAISLVQNIPYGWSGETISFLGQSLNYSRYPYEVLYDVQGVCEEKSGLLAFLLREIGYGVAFFYYPQENHEALGIKCPIENSLAGTGYCFIETTGPSILTDNSIEYLGGIKLSQIPEIILALDGDPLEDDLYEYEDSRKKIRIYHKIKQGKKLNYFESKKFNELNEKYGLVQEYNI